MTYWPDVLSLAIPNKSEFLIAQTPSLVFLDFHYCLEQVVAGVAAFPADVVHSVKIRERLKFAVLPGVVVLRNACV